MLLRILGKFIANYTASYSRRHHCWGENIMVP